MKTNSTSERNNSSFLRDFFRNGRIIGVLIENFERWYKIHNRRIIYEN